MGKKVVLIYLFLAVIVFFLLILMYQQNWFCNITINRDIPPLDVIGLIVSSLIALYVAWYIAKKLSSKRYEVEFVITDIKIIHTELENLQNTVSEMSELDLQLILKKIDKIIHLYERFKQTLSIAKLDVKSVTICDRKLMKLYANITDVDGKTLILDNSKSIQIDEQITAVLVELRKAILAINNK